MRDLLHDFGQRGISDQRHEPRRLRMQPGHVHVLVVRALLLRICQYQASLHLRGHSLRAETPESHGQEQPGLHRHGCISGRPSDGVWDVSAFWRRRKIVQLSVRGTHALVDPINLLPHLRLGLLCPPLHRAGRRSPHPGVLVLLQNADERDLEREPPLTSPACAWIPLEFQPIEVLQE